MHRQKKKGEPIRYEERKSEKWTRTQAGHAVAVAVAVEADLRDRTGSEGEMKRERKTQGMGWTMEDMMKRRL